MVQTLKAEYVNQENGLTIDRLRIYYERFDSAGNLIPDVYEGQSAKVSDISVNVKTYFFVLDNTPATILVYRFKQEWLDVKPLISFVSKFFGVSRDEVTNLLPPL